MDRLMARGRDSRRLKGIQFCTVGTATARALHERGVGTDLIPEEFRAEGVINAMVKQGPIRGKKILIPRAETAREILPASLRQAGAEVVVAPTYRNIRPEIDPQDLQEILVNRRTHMIVFTSPSNVMNFIYSVEKEGLRQELPGIQIATIGPVTSRAVEKAGLEVALEPEESTLESLSGAILRFYGKQGRLPDSKED
jgi:uroporphyrinogen III methyltransferase/synthase